MTSLIVRPSSSLMSIPAQQLDPLAIGKKLLVRFVLAGNFMRSDAGFDLNWQLLDTPSQSVRAGGSINVASFDLICVQTEICNEVFATLQGFGDLQNAADSAERLATTRPRFRSLNLAFSEDYLQARAVLSSFMSRTGSLDDLNRARELFENVVQQDEDYAPPGPAWASPTCSTRATASAARCTSSRPRRAFAALKLDPGLVEANLYHVICCFPGEKNTPATASSPSGSLPPTTGTSTSSPA